SAIGAVCRYSEECRARTGNSVCYNGRCLCSIGFHYSGEKDDCVKDIRCPSCPVTETPGGDCLGGMDLYCNGTCIGEEEEDEENPKVALSLLQVEIDKKQVATPNWPHNYPYGTDRYFCLSATSGRRVNLDFRWMDLETNCGMEDCDYVKVYDGCVADDRQNLLAFFNGDNSRSKECVTSVCNQMLIHFHSDPQKENKRADSRSGVMAYYKAVPYGDNPCSDVDNNFSDNRRVFKSVDFRLSTIATMSEVPALNVSPLIKSARWLMLLAGVSYGFTRHQVLLAQETERRRVEAEKKELRAADMAKEKMKKIRDELEEIGRQAGIPDFVKQAGGAAAASSGGGAGAGGGDRSSGSKDSSQQKTASNLTSGSNKGITKDDKSAGDSSKPKTTTAANKESKTADKSGADDGSSAVTQEDVEKARKQEGRQGDVDEERWYGAGEMMHADAELRTILFSSVLVGRNTGNLGYRIRLLVGWILCKHFKFHAQCVSPACFRYFTSSEGAVTVAVQTRRALGLTSDLMAAFGLNGGDRQWIVMPGRKARRLVTIFESSINIVPLGMSRLSATVLNVSSSIPLILFPTKVCIPRIKNIQFFCEKRRILNKYQMGDSFLALNIQAEAVLRRFLAISHAVFSPGDAFEVRVADSYHVSLMDSPEDLRFTVDSAPSEDVFFVDPNFSKVTLANHTPKCSLPLFMECVCACPVCPSLVPHYQVVAGIAKLVSASVLGNVSKPRILVAAAIDDPVSLTNILIRASSLNDVPYLLRPASTFNGESCGLIEGRLKQFYSLARQHAPCIAIISELQLFKRREERVGRRVVSCFEQLAMESEKLGVYTVATCRDPRDLDPMVAEIFSKVICVDLPSEAERCKFYENHQSLVRATGGFSSAQLEFSSVLKKLDQNKSVRDLVKDTWKAFNSEISYVPDVRWSDVGGLELAKTELREMLETSILNIEVSKTGLHRSGILLYGPPGTGKTLMAKAAASEFGLNFASVKGPELISMYVGQSERNIRDVFARARACAPCVIFFDELDSLAPNRGRTGDSGGVMDRIVAQFLSELDGIFSDGRVYLIGATNRPDLIDPALLRPGRFERSVYIGVATEQRHRVAILKALTKDLKLRSDVNLSEIANLCPEETTGAEFSSFCSDAVSSALRRTISDLKCDQDVDILVTPEDFRIASEASSVQKKRRENYKALYNSEEHIFLVFLRQKGMLCCACCQSEFPCEVLEKKPCKFTIYYNVVKSDDRITADTQGNADGPLADRTCPKCQNPSMSFATLQLRSADEGQTVFYTCPKCKHREFETT
ncbi:unnamed protein product, partial [Notodromas monacha]